MRLRSALAFVIALIALSAHGETTCLASASFVQSFPSIVDQQHAQLRFTLDYGTDAVQTVTAAVRSGATFENRYVVIVTVCDCYGEVPQTTRRRAVSHAVINPDDSPFDWREYADAKSAAEEYDRHEGALARGLTAMGNGTFFVYWSRVAE